MSSRILAIFIGLLLVSLSVWLVLTNKHVARLFVTTVDNIFYKEEISRRKNWQLAKNQTIPILIVDVDEKSILQLGPWPWPRSRFAELVKILFENGASVVAFNFILASKTNYASDYLKKLSKEGIKNPELFSVLNKIVYEYEGDEYLAKSIANTNTILGISFNDTPKYSKGQLPKPEFKIPPGMELLIPVLTGYIANYSLLQENAKNAGFVSGISDEDGIVRHVPLFIVYENGIYLSLALAIVKEYLNISKIDIELMSLKGKYAINKVLLGKNVILSDASGIIHIPFLNDNYFTKISAADILNRKFPTDSVQGKIVLIGSTSLLIGDRAPTPLSSSYPSIRIQANTIAGLLNNNSPYTPGWSRGVEIVFIGVLGIILAVIFPFISIAYLLISFLVLTILVFIAYAWLWTRFNIVFSITPTLLLIFNLATFNSVYGYLFVSRRLASVFTLFGRYVSPEHVKKISAASAKTFVAGGIGRAVILFADIRNFTGIAESLAINELTKFLNTFFDNMSKIIQDAHGTIDKFIGDEIMAFWEITEDEKLQNRNAIEAGLAIQSKIAEMREIYKESNFKIRIGVAINTGEVYVGDLGTDVRRSYTVIGDTVNATSRFESLSKFYNCAIIIGETTYQTSKDEYTFRFLDKVQLRGKTIPTRIYELIGNIQMRDDLLSELEEHEKAVNLYYERKWAEAAPIFESLTKKRPDVKVYSIFYQRSCAYAETPPPDDWDGSYHRI